MGRLALAGAGGLLLLANQARRETGARRRLNGLLLLWLPVMLLPSILGGQDVELSLSLRAIGVQPALYIWAALGLSASARAAAHLPASPWP